MVSDGLLWHTDGRQWFQMARREYELCHSRVQPPVTSQLAGLYLYGDPDRKHVGLASAHTRADAAGQMPPQHQHGVTHCPAITATCHDFRLRALRGHTGAGQVTVFTTRAPCF